MSINKPVKPIAPMRKEKSQEWRQQENNVNGICELLRISCSVEIGRLLRTIQGPSVKPALDILGYLQAIGVAVAP